MLFCLVQPQVGELQFGELELRVGFGDLLDESHDGQQFVRLCDLFHPLCQFEQIDTLIFGPHLTEFPNFDGQGVVVQHSVDDVLCPFVHIEVVDEVE